MVVKFIIFSQLLISTGGHINNSLFLVGISSIYGIGGNIFLKSKEKKEMSEFFFTYLRDLGGEREKVRGWEFGMTLWRGVSGEYYSNVYYGFTGRFSNYRRYYYSYEREVFLVASFSGLFNIKIDKYALGFKGSIGWVIPYSLLFFFFFIHYEVGAIFYRLPE